MSELKKKNMLKDITVIIGERAKRVRHSHVCSIENRGYVYVIAWAGVIFGIYFTSCRYSGG